jgi:HKD family nuclease
MSNNKFISNNSNSNHLAYILQNFEEADEIWMATAFLKMSGLNLLLPSIKKHLKLNKAIHIIAGQNFGLTEPGALRKLYDEFGNNSKAEFYLDKAEGSQSVFHPKLFIFKNESKGIIISGSANITKGGLTTNKEASLFVETSLSSAVWKEVIKYYNEICNKENADSLSLMIINRYKDFFEEQKRIRQKQKASPDKKSSDYSFSYLKLKKRLKDYKIEDFKEKFKHREADYKKAKQLLNEIVDSKRLTQVRFEEIIELLVGKSGQKALWQSGSMNRHKAKVFECKDEFRTLVKFIQENQKSSPKSVFSTAKELVQNVNGARINYVTEVMMTFQPERFANLNNNPITVLKEEAGVYFKSHSSSYTGDDYQEYCLITQEICGEFELKNLLEVDSFFNEIYWKLKQENN